MKMFLVMKFYDGFLFAGTLFLPLALVILDDFADRLFGDVSLSYQGSEPGLSSPTNEDGSGEADPHIIF